MQNNVQPWLAEVPWDLVEFQNAALCEAKNALHRPTSEGYLVTKELWEANFTTSLMFVRSGDAL